MTLSFHLLKILGQVRVLFPTDTLLLHSTKTVRTHTYKLQLITILHCQIGFYWTETPLGSTLPTVKKKQAFNLVASHHLSMMKKKCAFNLDASRHLYKQKKTT